MSASQEQMNTKVTENNTSENVEGGDQQTESSDTPKKRSKRSLYDGPGRKNAAYDGIEEEEFQ
ncbi:hypothetical protein TcasGA2_TC003508 [Tribolium castaneum]|uniref:Uncharacterized protein n=1 Tax=Tribolium castaneum TaxID=7070 RepID=D6WHB3_TRICA|nr:hypothetical protein TcasGA2_TC003508 [Tribolium castaneum]